MNGLHVPRLLPPGKSVDVIDGIDCTLVDNGMPCVIMRATDLGVTGYESREQLHADEPLKARLETIRLQTGPMMALGDVKDKTVPKMPLVSKAQNGGAIGTRSFIPHRCHATIGVFAAISVASGCLIYGSPAQELAVIPKDGLICIEHPTGAAEMLIKQDNQGGITVAVTSRTTRKLLDGKVY